VREYAYTQWIEMGVRTEGIEQREVCLLNEQREEWNLERCLNEQKRRSVYIKYVFCSKTFEGKLSGFDVCFCIHIVACVLSQSPYAFTKMCMLFQS